MQMLLLASRAHIATDSWTLSKICTHQQSSVSAPVHAAKIGQGSTQVSRTCRRCCPSLFCIILSCCSSILRSAIALILAYSRHQCAASASCLSCSDVLHCALARLNLSPESHRLTACRMVLTACRAFSLLPAVRPASTDSLKWRASRPVCLR